ncbi:MAG: LacI family DNA-binding transcriptional regulator [Acetivibrionales bacterium]|jgi:LacI family transcriptional regulator
MAVTIKDVAKACGVSYATVSRAFNNSSEISEYTKEKVLKVAQSMGYSPNAVARSLVKNKTNIIALIVPDIVNQYFHEVAKGVEDEANKLGYSVMLCNTDYDIDKEVVYREALLEKRVEGFIVAPTSDETGKVFRNSEVPVVLVGDMDESNNLNYVTSDNVKGAFLATEYLIKMGHTNIAFIGGHENVKTNRDRLRGFMNALEHYEIDESEIIIKSKGYKMKDGYDSATEIINSGKLPTAIFTANDLTALGVIKALDENSLSIPEDISVIGFDDISFASLPRINLTTVRQPKYEIGRIAVNILIDKLNNPEHTEPEKVVLETELVIRKTCKRISTS